MRRPPVGPQALALRPPPRGGLWGFAAGAAAEAGARAGAGGGSGATAGGGVSGGSGELSLPLSPAVKP